MSENIAHLLRQSVEPPAIAKWLSAALEDPGVCEEMKVDIRAWFAAGHPPAGAVPEGLTDERIDRLANAYLGMSGVENCRRFARAIAMLTAAPQSQQSNGAQLESDIEKLIDERDHWHDRATELAERVGEHFGIDVGEHTSANCPVTNAISEEWPGSAYSDLYDALQSIIEDDEFCGEEWGDRVGAWRETARDAISGARGDDS